MTTFSVFYRNETKNFIEIFQSFTATKRKTLSRFVGHYRSSTAQASNPCSVEIGIETIRRRSANVQSYIGGRATSLQPSNAALTISHDHGYKSRSWVKIFKLKFICQALKVFERDALEVDDEDTVIHYASHQETIMDLGV
ncbi:hypothetical protein QE152_g25099 [Popillia japonica]|uniref:Uncharacterized protein n=1 Tax=Popillia japonica TaxID=7064 RepID=A0AAW1K2Z6_POPJA